MFFDPAQDGIHHGFHLVFGKCGTSSDAEKGFQTGAVVAAGGMLRNEHRMAFGRGLTSVIRRVCGSDTLVDIVGGVQPQNIQWGSIMAAGVVTTVPMMFLGLLIRRYLVAGLTMGAVKE